MKHQKWAGCYKEIEKGLTPADWLLIGWAICFFTFFGFIILKG